MSLVLKNDVIEPVIQFVTGLIESQDWKGRYSALRALGCINEGPEKTRFAQILIPSMTQLLSMFDDKSVKVREGISWVTFQICQHHADVMVGSAESTAFFVNILTRSIQDQPKISAYICQAIEKFAKSLEPMDPSQQANSLTPHFETLAQALIQNTTRVDEDDVNSNLVIKSYTGLISLCEYCCTDSYKSLQAILMHGLQKLEESISESPSQRLNDI